MMKIRLFSHHINLVENVLNCHKAKQNKNYAKYNFELLSLLIPSSTDPLVFIWLKAHGTVCELLSA